MVPRIFAALFLGVAFTARVDAQANNAPSPPAGSVEIVKVKDGEFRYRIKDAEGSVIAIPPGPMAWPRHSDVLKVIQEVAKTLQENEPTEDPKSKEEFKDQESAYSYRIRNRMGTIVAVPPSELQWSTRFDVLIALRDIKAILQTSKPIEVSEQHPLGGGEYHGLVLGANLPTTRPSNKGIKK